ncbi:MAG: hypothetical protein EBW11_10200 [Betaproteobacteria bacterium]|nr:hypothetical protein [Betaproteobacteria bacterium]
MNTTDHVFEETKIAGQSRCVAETLTMNLLPAVLFLALANRMAMAEVERRLWRWLSFGAVLLMALYALSPSSTAIDRIGLYFIPLQLAVFSHLPGALRRAVSPTFMAFSSVLYFGTVLFVWLAYAVHASGWLPYQSVIWSDH